MATMQNAIIDKYVVYVLLKHTLVSYNVFVHNFFVDCLLIFIYVVFSFIYKATDDSRCIHPGSMKDPVLFSFNSKAFFSKNKVNIATLPLVILLLISKLYISLCFMFRFTLLYLPTSLAARILKYTN